MTITQAPPAQTDPTELVHRPVSIPKSLYDAARQAGMSDAEIQRTVQDAAVGSLADAVGTREAQRR